MTKSGDDPKFRELLVHIQYYGDPLDHIQNYVDQLGYIQIYDDPLDHIQYYGDPLDHTQNYVDPLGHIQHDVPLVLTDVLTCNLVKMELRFESYKGSNF